MRTFRDNQNRTWQVSVTAGSIKRVRSMRQFDLIETTSGQAFQRLASDTILLVDVLYALCLPQAEALGVSETEFDDAMAGDVIEAAQAALIEDLIDFFHLPAQRKGLRQAWEAMLRAREAASRILDQQIDQALATIEERAIGEMKNALTYGGLSIDSPASSASTPTH